MALIDLISADVVKVPLRGGSKDEIIRELLGVLAASGRLADERRAYEAVLAREALGSTGLENGIAVPHAKTTAVNDLTIAIGIAPLGIDFQALDGKPSTLFFLILAPPDKSGPHIEALAEIARMTRSTAFCRAVASARSAEEVVELFRSE
jgi:mannitol/fructose-specific phosphotransferase system IIA component (Ntr-type)